MSYNSSSSRGVNVTHYLRTLRQDPVVMEEPPIDDDSLAKDLQLFTNTQFWDSETGLNTDYQAPPVKPESTAADPISALSPIEDVASDFLLGDFPASMDFNIGDFNFADFTTSYTSPTIPSYSDGLGAHLHHQPLHPGSQNAYPAPISHHQPPPPPPHVQHHQHQPQPGYVAAPAPLVGGGQGGVVVGMGGGVVIGEKRKAESISAATPGGRMLNFEDQSRLAAEEDKRKRNTAASARFRIKKKQREQALEKSAKEMTEKVTALENRINALETENKWLKGLVTEKHGGSSNEEILQKVFRQISAAQQQQQKQAAALAKANTAAAAAAAAARYHEASSSDNGKAGSVSSDEEESMLREEESISVGSSITAAGDESDLVRKLRKRE